MGKIPVCLNGKIYYWTPDQCMRRGVIGIHPSMSQTVANGRNDQIDRDLLEDMGTDSEQFFLNLSRASRTREVIVRERQRRD